MSLLGFKEKIGHLVGTLSTGQVASDNLHSALESTCKKLKAVATQQQNGPLNPKFQNAQQIQSPASSVSNKILTMVSKYRNCKNKFYNVVDLETPNQNNDRMSCISITQVFGSDILDTKSYLVNPEVPFSSFNSSLTGITERTIQNAPIFPQIWKDINTELQKGPFVAHNALFDLSVLSKCLHDYGFQLAPICYIDTMEIARDVFPELDHYGLDNICKFIGIHLEHHHADSDSHACATILSYCINQGIEVDNYLHILDPNRFDFSDENKKEFCSVNSFHARNLSDKTKQINRLLSIVETVCQDAQVTADEVYMLRQWMEEHPELAKEFPYALIHASIEESLQDGILDPQELQQLFKTFLFLLDPLGCTFSCDHIDFTEKMVCLSGNFDYGPKEDVEALLEKLGATIHPRVVAKLDYLIVGNHASDEWSCGRYGNKIKQAIQLQMKGKPIKIVKESDLIGMLQRG